MDLDAEPLGVRLVDRRPVADDQEPPPLVAQDVAALGERLELLGHPVPRAVARLDEVAHVAPELEPVPRRLPQPAVTVACRPAQVVEQARRVEAERQPDV